MTMKEQSSQSAILQEKRKRTTLSYIVSVCFLFICIYLNLAIGSSHIEFKDIIHYITGHTDTKQTFLIHNSRMPRMLAGLLIGGALALAGLLMQSITRNPLASPQIFGVNAGASFVIVLITVLIPSLESYSMILAMIGAFLGGLTVYTLSGSTKAMTPVKLALAGMAVHLFFSSMTQGVILLNEDSNSSVMFWLVGSLLGVKWPEVIAITPWLVVAMIVTMLMGRQLTIMELGDDIAKGLGQKIQVVRMLLGLLVIILTGLSVSIAGPIGFVGLIVPHIVKRYIKNNYILMIPLTIIIGADLLLFSDVLSRLVTHPFESPVGIVTSFVGAFYFLFITVKGVKRV
ncbi:FecCD family ABC transporter permease [Staphylococcus warneri]|uniref:FecCD family ABC transporter permease n=1 Tax=Staphylococcus warneri TaxID=1292 RepID=UPI000E5D8853|nr:iron ABC transporter permease [Staphylococcus warneri]AXZ22874.1 iron ABC transporter permease [Staphylococcus warneri]